MKLLCGFFFSFISLYGIAQQNITIVTQNDFSNSSDRAYQPIIGNKEKIKLNQIKTATTIQTYKGKMIWKKVEEFDTNGNMTRQMMFNSSGLTSSNISWEYNLQNQLISSTNIISGCPRVTRYFYDQNGKRTEQRGYDVDGYYYGRKKIYDPSNNKIASELLFEVDSINPIKKLDYFYYEDGSKKSMNYYVADELIYTWTFDCGEEGKIIDMKESDTSLVCIRKEIDSNGREITWRHEINSTGTPIKIKTISENGKSIIETKYNSADKIISEMIYFKDGGYILNYYDKKGRIYNSNETIYNLNGEYIFSTFGFDSRHLQKSWSDYKDGLISKTTTVTKKKVRTTEYSYTFN